MGWVEQAGWEALLNRRGTTWRNAPRSLRDACDEVGAIQFMLANPSAIKRPVLDKDGLLEIGFCEVRYEEIFR
jgi:arsenate reductase